MLIERSAKYSEFSLEGNYTRAQVVAVLGEPESSHTEEKPSSSTTDTYTVSGRVFDCGRYWASGAGWVMTLGLHELFMFPAAIWSVVKESVAPSQKVLEIRYMGDAYQCQRVSKEP